MGVPSMMDHEFDLPGGMEILRRTPDTLRVLLDGLPEEWTHPEFGAVTLRQLLATWVTHDLSHLAQIARVMAKQYRTAVGPWRKYLSVLDRP